MFRHAKGQKGVSRKELKREAGSRSVRMRVRELEGVRGGRDGGSWRATIPVNEPTVTLEQPPLHLQRRLLLEIVSSRRVCTDGTTAVFIPSAVYVS